jgi:hypothetical protein
MSAADRQAKRLFSEQPVGLLRCHPTGLAKILTKRLATNLDINIQPISAVSAVVKIDILGHLVLPLSSCRGSFQRSQPLAHAGMSRRVSAW